MILRKINEYKKGAEINEKTGNFKELEYDINSKTKTRGFYDIIEGNFIALYHTVDYKFFIIINNHRIEYNSNTKIEYNNCDAKHTLIVNSDEQEIRLDYTLSIEPLSTPWYTECEEDVNIGLWIYNILNSELRRNILLGLE